MTQYTISELAKLAHTTTRTLRYYDQIGLLTPTIKSYSGFRIYSSDDIKKLQKILFYRELNISLSNIDLMLQGTTNEQFKILKDHYANTVAERDRLNKIIDSMAKTIDEYEGGMMMTDEERFEAFKKEAVELNEHKYGNEIRHDYGEENVEASNRKFLNMDQKEYNNFINLEEEIKELLVIATSTNDPRSPQALHLVKEHKKWIKMTWHNFTDEAYRGLAELYINSPDFKQYYDAVVKDGAQFLHDAIIYSYE